MLTSIKCSGKNQVKYNVYIYAHTHVMQACMLVIWSACSYIVTLVKQD